MLKTKLGHIAVLGVLLSVAAAPVYAKSNSKKEKSKDSSSKKDKSKSKSSSKKESKKTSKENSDEAENWEFIEELEEREQSLLAAPGELWVDMVAMLDLSQERQGLPGKIGDPISLNPDIRYGLSPSWEVGLFHSQAGVTGFVDTAGGGLCILGNSCANVYGGPTGFIAAHQFSHGETAIAVRSGLVYRKFGSASLMSALIGMRLRHRAGAVELEFDPSFRAGLNERDTSVPPNKEEIFAPVSLLTRAGSITFRLQSGIRGLVFDFPSNYQVPVSVGLAWDVSETVAIAGQFSMYDLAGANGGSARRGMNLSLHYHP